MITTRTARPRAFSAYRPLNTTSVLSYLRTVAIVDQCLGGTPATWRARECGDGNLNLVFVVQGISGAVVVKQALPYVRMVGKGWPLSVRRSFFECAALREQARWAAEFVPIVYHADESMALIIMEFLTSHQVLRSAWIRGGLYPRVGEQLGLFLARTLFNTSELRLSSAEKKQRMSVFLANTAMCQISEDLIFDEPYFKARLNRHTTPQLDAIAHDLIADTDLKIAVQDMKWRFVNQPEALIHGDLHTGSIMVAQDDTRVIDPEFAAYGPMGFDWGALLANFLMAYYSQPGHELQTGDRAEFEVYLVEQLIRTWVTFAGEFSRLWYEQGPRKDGNLFNQRLNVDSPDFLDRALALQLRRIWRDALGFAGCEMIRRIVGLAHIADFESIEDPDRRAQCERQTLCFARRLLLEPSQFGSISELAASIDRDRS